MERAFFKHNVFVLSDRVITKEWLLIEIKTIQNSSNALRRHMYFKKDDGRRAVFGSL